MARFQKGQSGNPAGRPRQTDTEFTQREAIRTAIPGIIERLISSATDGDVSAAKLLLERVIPALKPLDLPVQINLGGSPADAGRAVLAHLGIGAVTPDQASKILGGIGTLARVIEADELIRRVEVLEAASNGKPAE